MILHTPRLLLRPFEANDWSDIHEYAGDPEVVTHMEWGPNTWEETLFFLQDRLQKQTLDEKQDFPLAIVLKADNKIVGNCHLFVEHPENREAWIGYVLNRSYWGQGIMTEAAQAVLAFGFEELGLHRIYATCSPKNLGSQRVLEKIGMTREGHLRQHKWMKGQWRDSYLDAILDWEFRNPA